MNTTREQAETRVAEAKAAVETARANLAAIGQRRDHVSTVGMVAGGYVGRAGSDAADEALDAAKREHIAAVKALRALEGGVS